MTRAKMLGVAITLGLLIGLSGNVNAGEYVLEITGVLETANFGIGPFASAGVGDQFVMSYTVDSEVYTSHPDYPDNLRKYTPLADFTLEIDGITDTYNQSAGQVEIFNDFWTVDDVYASGSTQGGVSASFSVHVGDSTWLPTVDIADAVGSWAFQDLAVAQFGCSMAQAGGGQSFCLPETIEIIALDGPTCSGDTNDDGFVNVNDLTEVILNWGATGGSADINGDGFVNVNDLTEVILNWGAC